MREIINHITYNCSAGFILIYHHSLAYDMEMDALGSGWNDPQLSIKNAVRRCIATMPEEWNPVFEPFFTKEEILNMKRGKAA